MLQHLNVFRTKLELKYLKDLSISIKMCKTIFLVMLVISLANTEPNNCGDREMAVHAKALDDIYLTQKQGNSMIF